MLRFFTSGESHGRVLLTFVEGLPAGLTVNIENINKELARRQAGYGRSSRQKLEKDEVQVLAGIRHGITSGAPIVLQIANKEFENWAHVMSDGQPDLDNEDVSAQLEKKAIERFRPGHADLAGTIKFHQRDIRDVLERSSARETAARVAAGALCEEFLRHMQIFSAAHLVQIGDVKTADSVCELTSKLSIEEINQRAQESDLLCLDTAAATRMRQLITRTWQDGDSLGGIIEVVIDGVPIGLGSYTQWDLKLDGRLAQALMSIQAIKAVEIGQGISAAGSPGSQVHDALYPSPVGAALPFARKTNRAGGIEGGMSNGERILLRAFMKPIPTIREGLDSLSFPKFEAQRAHYERSDVCAAPSAAIVCKAMANIVLTSAFLDKFAGDSVSEVCAALGSYKEYCRKLKCGDQPT